MHQNIVFSTKNDIKIPNKFQQKKEYRCQNTSDSLIYIKQKQIGSKSYINLDNCLKRNENSPMELQRKKRYDQLIRNQKVGMKNLPGVLEDCLIDKNYKTVIILTFFSLFQRFKKKKSSLYIYILLHFTLSFVVLIIFSSLQFYWNSPPNPLVRQYI